MDRIGGSRVLGGLAAAAVAALGLASPALAHPHIFIDAAVHPVFDTDGKLAAVRVVWRYDELYSLLVLEDMGLDQDYDGVLTEAEIAALDGFDMNWDPDYAGDLYVLAEERELALSRPVEHSTQVQDGRIVTMHTRALETRVEVGTAPVVFQVYDPSFYTAYQLTLPSRVEGREDCTAQVYTPDLTDANRALLDALAELGANQSVEDYDFPAVGADFAEELRLACASPS
jgi:ABC-type uncharacterized transport system substrate-binding protein